LPLSRKEYLVDKERNMERARCYHLGFFFRRAALTTPTAQPHACRSDVRVAAALPAAPRNPLKKAKLQVAGPQHEAFAAILWICSTQLNRPLGPKPHRYAWCSAGTQTCAAAREGTPFSHREGPTENSTRKRVWNRSPESPPGSCHLAWLSVTLLLHSESVQG
jgi:hypothetical protein